MKLDRTGKMKMTSSARSNSCLAMIPKADWRRHRRLSHWQRTHVFWHSSAILMPPLTSFYFPFRRPGDKDQFLDLVRSNEHMGSDYIEDDSMSPTSKRLGMLVRSWRSCLKTL
jgi:hypothetical protein